MHSRRNGEPVEPLRPYSSAEVGQGQEGSDTVGDGVAGDVRPSSGGQVGRKLQLIGLACDGDDVEDNVS